MGNYTAPTLDNTIGVLFLGVVFASILCGSTFAQTYVYYNHYRQDPILNKWAAAILCSLDTLHLAFFVHAVYDYSVTHYGKVEALLFLSWSLKLHIFLSVIVVVVVHSLYAHRVWMLSGYHKGVLRYPIAFVVVCGAVMGGVVSYVIFSSQTFADVEESAWAVYAAFSVSTSIDFVLAAAMCYCLRKSRGIIDTRLDSKISKIIQYTICSGLVTSSFSLVTLISYGLMPNTYVGFAFTGFVTKFYTASFLAMLNSREQPNNRVSGIFNSIPNTSERWLKPGTNPESGLHVRPTSAMQEECGKFPT